MKEKSARSRPLASRAYWLERRRRSSENGKPRHLRPGPTHERAEVRLGRALPVKVHVKTAIVLRVRDHVSFRAVEHEA